MLGSKQSQRLRLPPQRRPNEMRDATDDITGSSLVFSPFWNHLKADSANCDDSVVSRIHHGRESDKERIQASEFVLGQIKSKRADGWLTGDLMLLKDYKTCSVRTHSQNWVCLYWNLYFWLYQCIRLKYVSKNVSPGCCKMRLIWIYCYNLTC